MCKWPVLTTLAVIVLVSWVYVHRPGQRASGSDSTAVGSLLFSDTFDYKNRPWPYPELTPNDAVFEWMSGAVGSKIPLPPDHGAGYSIETEAREATSLQDGPAVVISFPGTSFSLSMLDGATWEMAKTFPGTFAHLVPFSTALHQPLRLRLDIPRTKGSQVAAFINDDLVFWAPLSAPITGPAAVFLLRRSTGGNTTYRYLTVHAYGLSKSTAVKGAVTTANP